MAQCWCHGIVVSVVVLTLLFRFHLSVFTGLVESPERGRELIAAQVVGIVVIKNGTYISVDTMRYCSCRARKLIGAKVV